jgi:hypothetical protein
LTTNATLWNFRIKAVLILRRSSLAPGSQTLTGSLKQIARLGKQLPRPGKIFPKLKVFRDL